MDALFHALLGHTGRGPDPCQGAIGTMTVVTVAVAWPRLSIVLYLTCQARAGRGIPNPLAAIDREASTAPFAFVPTFVGTP